jgi:hypothetical protein
MPMQANLGTGDASATMAASSASTGGGMGRSTPAR